VLIDDTTRDMLGGMLFTLLSHEEILARRSPKSRTESMRRFPPVIRFGIGGYSSTPPFGSVIRSIEVLAREGATVQATVAISFY